MGPYFTRKWVFIGSLSQSLGVLISFGDSAVVVCFLQMELKYISHYISYYIHPLKDMLLVEKVKIGRAHSETRRGRVVWLGRKKGLRAKSGWNFVLKRGFPPNKN